MFPHAFPRGKPVIGRSQSVNCLCSERRPLPFSPVSHRLFVFHPPCFDVRVGGYLRVWDDILIAMTLIWGYTQTPSEERGRGLLVDWPLLDVWLLAISQTLLFMRCDFSALTRRAVLGLNALLKATVVVGQLSRSSFALSGTYCTTLGFPSGAQICNELKESWLSTGRGLLSI